MSDMDLRRESRHLVKEGKNFCAVVSGAQLEGELPVRVADISNMGVRLNVGVKLDVGSELELKFVAPEIEAKRNVTVRWVHAGGKSEDWWIGGVFDRQLGIELIGQLAYKGFLERRGDERYSVNHPAKARWELANEPCHVNIVNYSVGGVCLAFENLPNATSERLLLTVDSEDEKRVEIPVRVMWQTENEGRLYVGCSFRTKEAFGLLRSRVETKERLEQRQLRRPTLHRRRTSRWVAISVFVLLSLQCVSYYRENAACRQTIDKGVATCRAQVAVWKDDISAWFVATSSDAGDIE